ncbi:MAG TPA: hypothetical protein PKK06_02010 [Phycisphaerae bacterium]|nr:hypothetical protein [Phycisphaerae bacterium]HNU44100.1 hypothetical protein [Phycisphaerae bacterium]
MSRTWMSAPWAALALSMLLAAGGCEITIGPVFPEAQKDFALTVPAADVGSLVIDWRRGSITVTVDPDATDISADGTAKVRAESQARAEQGLADLQITLVVAESFPAQAFLAFRIPAGGMLSYEADVEVVLPPRIALTVGNADGAVRLTGGDTLTIINVYRGNLTLTGQTGDAVVSVTDGDIAIDSAGASVDAEVVDSGNLQIDAEPPAGGYVLARVGRAGDIFLRLPADFAADLDLSSGAASLVVDLADFTITNLRIRRDRVQATLNGGGGEVTAGTELGTITFAALP